MSTSQTACEIQLTPPGLGVIRPPGLDPGSRSLHPKLCHVPRLKLPGSFSPAAPTASVEAPSGVVPERHALSPHETRAVLKPETL